MRTALFLTATIWALAPRSASAIEFGYRVEWQMTEGTALYRAKNVPVTVRDIPPHRGDRFLADWQGDPIADDRVNFRSWNGTARFLMGVRWGKFECLAGPTLFHTVDIDYPHPPLGWEGRKHLYTTYRSGDSFDDRCDCLRYYELNGHLPRFGARVLVSGWTPYRHIRRAAFRLRLSLEGDPFGRPLEFETGWDRYNRDEVRTVILAGRLREFITGLRVEFTTLRLAEEGVKPRKHFLYIDGGLVFSVFSPRDGFDALTLDNRDHFRFALGAGITN